MAEREKVRITHLKKMKEQGQKITMLTAYDYPTARLEDEAGIDIMLVGDSLGMVVLGYEDTVPVTMEDMIHHTKAVARGTERALVVGDMPFMSFQVSVEDTMKNAGRLLKEGMAQAVKLEGGEEVLPQTRALVKAGIPVMGHLGLTPQSVNQLGGFKVQGKEVAEAKKLIDDARLLEEAGIFSLVLECIPAPLAREITSELKVPTIGIGAGPDCDGQVLVVHDMLGMYQRFVPRFVRRYGEIGESMKEAFQRYMEDVRNGKFPAESESFSMDEETIKKLFS